jgi:hypothetical protein
VGSRGIRTPGGSEAGMGWRRTVVVCCLYREAFRRVAWLPGLSFVGYAVGTAGACTVGE